MFKRRNSSKLYNEKSKSIEFPPLEELEQWVLTLIIKLNLKPGNFTFLACYGGVLLFLKNEGLTWIPYREINDAIGRVDKNKLIENTAMLGGAAVAIAAHTMPLPAILLPKIIKGSYRIIAQPSPNRSMSFLQSTIEKIVIHETNVNRSLLDTFEEVPYKDRNIENLSTYTISIYRKFLDDDPKPKFISKLQKGIVTFFAGTSNAVFPIPPESDVQKFKDILEENGLITEWIEDSSKN